MRSIKSKYRNKKNHIFDIDITSLLDILVIMLVFLLKSYNTQNVNVNIPKDIKIARSQSMQIASNAINIQASMNKVWVDNKLIIDQKKSSQRLRVINDKIIPLYNELIAKKKLIKQNSKFNNNEKKFTGQINLTLDKEMPYRNIKKILSTCAEAGFKVYKFLVTNDL